MAKEPPNKKISDEKRIEVCKRWQAGEKAAELASEFGVSSNTIYAILKRNKITASASGKNTASREVSEFAKRVRSILWRTDKRRYEKWQQKVASLETDGGMSRREAIVQASKDYTELRKLFREFNVSDYDPNEDSHAGIEHKSSPSVRKGIPYTGEKLTQLDSLRWASTSAGHYLNTGSPPDKAPNAECFFYYRMALDEPREFMSRMVQLFARYDESTAEEKRVKRDTEMAVDEIMRNLTLLEKEDA